MDRWTDSLIDCLLHCLLHCLLAWLVNGLIYHLIVFRDFVSAGTWTALTGHLLRSAFSLNWWWHLIYSVI